MRAKFPRDAKFPRCCRLRHRSAPQVGPAGRQWIAGKWTSVAPSVNGQKFQGYGLNWVAAFAKEHNKPVSIPEWGLNAAGTNGGGGDDAYFVTHMASWIKANATGPAIFWNYGDGNLPLDIPHYTSGNTPDATAAFKAAFGAGA